MWLEGKGAAQAAKPEEALATPPPCSQASRPKGPGQQERPQEAAAAPGAPAAALGPSSPVSLPSLQGVIEAAPSTPGPGLP